MTANINLKNFLIDHDYSDNGVSDIKLVSWIEQSESQYFRIAG